MHLHENREKFAAPESRRARFIHNQTGMRPAEHLAVMQRARTCGSKEQLAPVSLRTMHHDGTMMGNAANFPVSLFSVTHPTASRSARSDGDYEGSTEGRRHRVAKCPSFHRATHFMPSERLPPAQAHTRACTRPLLPLPLKAITLLPCPPGPGSRE